MKYAKIHQKLEGKILKDYGKPCKTFCISCSVCQVYLMLSILEDCASSEEVDLGMRLCRIHPK